MQPNQLDEIVLKWPKLYFHEVKAKPFRVQVTQIILHAILIVLLVQSLLWTIGLDNWSIFNLNDSVVFELKALSLFPQIIGAFLISVYRVMISERS